MPEQYVIHRGEVTHTSVIDSPVKVEVSKGQRGSYGWTVTVSGKTVDEVLKLIDEADEKLLEKYREATN